MRPLPGERRRTRRGTQMILSMRRCSNGGSLAITTHGLPVIVTTSPISASLPFR